MFNKIRERINLLIGGILAALGIGATGCDVFDNFRIISDDITIPDKEDSVEVIVCKYGVPSDTIKEESQPQDPDTGDVVCMYGVPSARFRIQGSVSDRATGKALDKIQVMIDTRSMQETVLTNEDGVYEFKTDWIFPSDSVFVTFTDTQDEYQEQRVGEAMEYHGGTGPWDSGEADMRIDAQLEKKE